MIIKTHCETKLTASIVKQGQQIKTQKVKKNAYFIKGIKKKRKKKKVKAHKRLKTHTF